MRVPSPLARIARSGSASQPSTSVHAPQWMTRSGAAPAMVSATWSRAAAIASCPVEASTRTTSMPSWPWAPVTTTRITRSRPSGHFVDRGAVAERLPPRAVLLIPEHGLAQPDLEGDLRRPTDLGLDLRPVERVAAIVAGPVGNDHLQRRRFTERRQHAVRDLLHAAFDARTDV